MALFDEIRGMSDEQLEQWTAKALADSQGQTGMSGEWASNRLVFGLTEMQLRSQRATRQCIGGLQKSIEDFNLSSDKSARAIVRLTRVLVALTVLLVALAVIMAVPIVKEFLVWCMHRLG